MGTIAEMIRREAADFDVGTERRHGQRLDRYADYVEEIEHALGIALLQMAETDSPGMATAFVKKFLPTTYAVIQKHEKKGSTR